MESDANDTTDGANSSRPTTQLLGLRDSEWARPQVRRLVRRVDGGKRVLLLGVGVPIVKNKTR